MPSFESRCPLCRGQNLKPVPKVAGTYFQCVACDFIWLDPACRLPSHLEKLRYQQHNNDVNDPKYIRYLLKTWHQTSALTPEGALVVDYGCGPTQGLASALNGQNFQIFSYDPFFFPIELETFRGQVDVLFCSEAIEHMHAPAKSLELWLELLKPQGVLTMRTAFHPGPNRFYDWWYKDDPTHVGFFSRLTMEWIAGHYHLKALHLHSPYASFQK